MDRIFDAEKTLYQIARCGLNPSSASVKAGLHRNTLPFLLKGRSKRADPITLYKLAIALGCKVEDITSEKTETGKE